MADKPFTEEALQAITDMSHGLPRAILILLANSSEMLTASQLQVKLIDTSLTDTDKTLRWLQDWGMVTHVGLLQDDVYQTHWSATNSGISVLQSMQSLPPLDGE